MTTLLTRKEFREAVFKRDGYRCIICQHKAIDAHHIMERRLFDDGGYYIDNGASLCGEDHYRAEMTILPTWTLRQRIGAASIVLPPHLYTDQGYDKWGNIIVNSCKRLPGELFYDKSVQKVLEKGKVLSTFDKRIKYPRTYHLPWSPGGTKDDRTLDNASCFADKDVVVTVKMDGEQTTMYNDCIHARSINQSRHPSRSWVLNLHGKMAHDIPEDFRVCGENLYAKHSIHYKDLPTFFMVFSIWQRDKCFSWAETTEYAKLLGLMTVPVIYEGPFDRAAIQKAYDEIYTDNVEGYVVRLSGSFGMSHFRQSTAKYVRKSHVQTTHNWMHQQVIPNELKK